MALVPLQKEHLRLILPWRNSLAVRRAMFNHHIISIEEHLSWFEELKKDDTKQWFLFIDEKDEPQGVVYFTEINYEHQTAFWGFYARPEVISGTGLKMELDALDFAFEELKVVKLSCEVLANNPGVINMHIKVGFSEEGRFREQHLIENQRLDIVRLGLTASEWLTNRTKIAKRVSQLIDIRNKLPLPALKS